MDVKKLDRCYRCGTSAYQKRKAEDSLSCDVGDLSWARWIDNLHDMISLCTISCCPPLYLSIAAWTKALKF